MSEQNTATTLADARRMLGQILAIAQMMQMTREAEPSELSDGALARLGGVLEDLADQAENIIAEAVLGAQ